MPMTHQTLPEYFQDQRPFTLLLYGAPGTGKTILSASAQQHPELSNLAYIDADPGLASIADEESGKIHRINFDNVKELKDLSRWIRSNLPDVKTVVFDTIAALGALRIVELEGEGEVTDRRHYGSMVKGMGRILHNLHEAEYNIIMTAGVKDEQFVIEGQPTRMIKRRPNTTPALWDMLSYFAGNTWHTYLSPDGSYNILIRPMFPPTGGEIVAKTRSERFNQLLKPLERSNYPGVIQIGKVGEDSNNYPNLRTFYDLYKQALGAKDGS